MVDVDGSGSVDGLELLAKIFPEEVANDKAARSQQYLDPNMGQNPNSVMIILVSYMDHKLLYTRHSVLTCAPTGTSILGSSQRC